MSKLRTGPKAKRPQLRLPSAVDLRERSSEEARTRQDEPICPIALIPTHTRGFPPSNRRPSRQPFDREHKSDAAARQACHARRLRHRQSAFETISKTQHDATRRVHQKQRGQVTPQERCGSSHRKRPTTPQPRGGTAAWFQTARPAPICEATTWPPTSPHQISPKPAHLHASE